jgi:hypothetical protein
MNDPQLEGHMESHIRQRKFLATLLGGAAAWPLAARLRRRRQIGFGEELQSAGWQEPVDQRLCREAAGVLIAERRELMTCTFWASAAFKPSAVGATSCF